MNITMEPLNMERATLQDVNPYTLKDCADELYCKRLAKAKYLLVSREDYAALCLQLNSREWTIRTGSTGNFMVKQVFGMYIAPLPGLPEDQEYSQARVTFEYLEYDYTPLKKGEVIILYAERS